MTYKDDGSTPEDLREAVDTLEELNGPDGACSVARTRSQKASRIELRDARASAHARETPPTDAQEDGDLDEVEDV